MKKIALLISVILLLSSCGSVSQEKYDELVEKNEQLNMELADRDDMLATLVGDIKDLREEIESLEDKLDQNQGGSPSDEGETAIEEHQIVDVSNAADLVSNMGSNRTFVLNPGDYDLSKVDENLSIHFDGYSFVNLENVEFIGNVQLQLDFLTEDLYRPVIAFRESKNIKLSNLYIGHEPVSLYGYCEGEVVFLNNCEDVYIGNSTLYGCGTVGIYGNNVTNLVCEDTVIRDCSEDLLLLYNSNNLSFINCEFQNRSDEHLVFNECQTILIENSSLMGGMVAAPEVRMDGQVIYQLDSSLSNERFDNLQIATIELKNIQASGNELLIEISQLYSDVKIDLTHYDDEYSGPTSYCTITYDGDVDLATILEHRTDVEKKMKAYYTEKKLNYDIDIYQIFGDRSIYEDYMGQMYLNAETIEWSQLDSAIVDYLPIEEALKIAHEAYLPKYKVQDWQVVMPPIIEHETYISRILLDVQNPQYVFRFEDKNLGTRELYVHALTGEVTAQFDFEPGFGISEPTEALMNQALEMFKTELQFQEITEIQAMVLGGKWLIINNDYSWSTAAEIVTDGGGEVTLKVYWEYEGGH